ncbi:MAG: hypothetical protein ABS44_05520 [Chryseobacterium sp. SCN 40-13]|nr:MAG: hypothetical protein ABS44_05520 [Chryseobacterium sp. SCN 40-13]
MIISPILMLFATVVYLIFLILAFLQMMKRERGLNLLVWLLVLIFVPFLGSILYFVSMKFNSKDRVEIIK